MSGRSNPTSRAASTRPLRVAALAVGAAALVSGCAAVGPDFQRPAPPGSDSYAQAGDTANGGPIDAVVGKKVVADWWTLFQSPALDELVREAIANNKTLEAARARLAAARAAEGADTGLAFANLDSGFKREGFNFTATGFPTRSFPAGFPTNPAINIYTIGANVSYNLDLFGHVRRLKEAHKADTETQAQELDAAYLTLTGHVVAQALTIADANIQISALSDIVANDETDLTMVRRARGAGGAADADVKTIETELAEDLAAIPAQRQRLAAARHQLAVLVGKEPGQWSPPDFDAHFGALPERLPVALPSELVHTRPDILAAEARLHAATARIGVATAALYPNITLSAGASQDSITPEKIFSPIANSYALGPALTLPLFDSGELHAKKREAEANAQAALADYEQTVLAAFAQVDDALQAIAHDNDAYAELSRALDAATSKLEMMRGGYRAGGVSALQLVDAERSWRRTRLGLSEQGVGRYADAALLLLAAANVPPGVAEAGPPANP